MQIRLGEPEDFAEAADRLPSAVMGYCVYKSEDDFFKCNKQIFATDFLFSVFKHAKSIGYSNDMLILPLQLLRKLFDNGEFTPQICDEINSAFPQFLETAARGIHCGYLEIVKGNVTLTLFLRITPIAFDVDSTRGKY